MADAADDMTDLEQARRVIALLRAQLTELEEQNTPVAGEFTVFLDDEHAAMLETLFRLKKLVDDQDPEIELDDALAEFISGWLEVRWDMAKQDDGDGDGRAPGMITPSA